MRTIHYPLQSEDLRVVVRRIVQDLEDSHTYEGELFVTRVLPSSGSSTSTAAREPHLVIEEERGAKLLGLIPYRRKTTVCIIREAFYDVAGTGNRDMFVVLRCKRCENVVRKHLEEYGRRHNVTQIIYWGRNRLRPPDVVSL
jgi:uncharacterized C2H2 Zn-finger protein